MNCPVKLNEPLGAGTWKMLNWLQRISAPSLIVCAPRIKFSPSVICRSSVERMVGAYPGSPMRAYPVGAEERYSVCPGVVRNTGNKQVGGWLYVTAQRHAAPNMDVVEPDAELVDCCRGERVGVAERRAHRIFKTITCARAAAICQSWQRSRAYIRSSAQGPAKE